MICENRNEDYIMHSRVSMALQYQYAWFLISRLYRYFIFMCRQNNLFFKGESRDSNQRNDQHFVVIVHTVWRQKK